MKQMTSKISQSLTTEKSKNSTESLRGMSRMSLTKKRLLTMKAKKKETPTTTKKTSSTKKTFTFTEVYCKFTPKTT